ncbi:MAG: C4-dicarboxylate ABC transporter [Desulfobacterales bacterium RIFOXYA12_FULL_46_15]|nr:MAG: C4-dicarboxylate ABC transporter [Desulfobacula sp. GWF2_41_7]OGR22147.1 MAG: C4-dicarboxylate ABC transporter [Desulfobacterales bacterium RIFOXYA12_FULL_46_15]
MNAETLAITMFFTLFLALMLGHPLAFSLGTLAVIFGVIGWGGSLDAILGLLANRAYGVMEEYVLVAVPLFIFMALILDASGIARRLFETMHVVMGRIRGGLGIAVILASTVFAATAGVVGATEVSIGLLAIPALMKVRYNIPLIAGTICAGGTLGILIPPSIMLVVYGSLTQISVGWLYAAAFSPGLLLAGLYVIYIAVLCIVKPEYGPPETGSDHTTAEKLNMFAISIVPPLVLVFIVMGSIIGGVATPTEAAGLGCVGAIVLALAYRKFSWKIIKDACWSTTLTTSMIMTLFLGGNAFQAIFMGLGGGDAIANFLLGTQLSPIALLFVMMGIIFFLGCFLDWLGILLIVTPIFIPVTQQLGFNQLWFGTLICINLQMAFLTPPFGYSLFYLKGIAPPEMTIYHIYKGVVPFVILQWVGLILCIIWPEIILWAPRAFFGASVG